MKPLMRITCLCGVLAVVVSLPAAERINHEGRILGAVPVVTNAILFNTPAADAIVSALQILPRDNAWNEGISRRPLLTNSDAMIAQGNEFCAGPKQPAATPDYFHGIS